jgi:ankyrin repeat protein
LCGALALWLLFPLACGGGERAAEPDDAGTQIAGEAPAPEAPAVRPDGHALGIGEPLEPAPFTREQRYLEAARQGDLSTLARALELGVAVDAKDDLGRSALLLATRDAGSLEAVVFLEQRGAAADEPDVEGRTPLSWAAEAGHLPLVKHLLERGATLDQPDVQGRTPLFHAVLGNQPETVSFLLDAGADVNPADAFGDTPLMLACAKGRGELAALLLARGADVSLRNQEGRTARDRAAPGTDACFAGGASEL